MNAVQEESMSKITEAGVNKMLAEHHAQMDQITAIEQRRKA